MHVFSPLLAEVLDGAARANHLLRYQKLKLLPSTKFPWKSSIHSGKSRNNSHCAHLTSLSTRSRDEFLRTELSLSRDESCDKEVVGESDRHLLLAAARAVLKPNFPVLAGRGDRCYVFC